jgi:Fe-S-cluster containining protein
LAKQVEASTLSNSMKPDLTEYDCTQCGACCRSFPIFASDADALREPAIRNETRHLAEHLQSVNMAYQLFPLPFQTRCAFLKDDELCRIYETRPSVCRRFEAGSEQCIEARRRQGIGAADTNGK